MPAKSLNSHVLSMTHTPQPSEKKCNNKKLKASKAQFLNFSARVSELKVPLRDKAGVIKNMVRAMS